MKKEKGGGQRPNPADENEMWHYARIARATFGFIIQLRPQISENPDSAILRAMS